MLRSVEGQFPGYSKIVVIFESVLFTELQVLPLVKLVYNYSSENSNFVYMALIILLIMTENSVFNSSIHREIVDYLYWIKEKTITNMSIGSLTIWVLCRTIQYNFGFIGVTISMIVVHYLRNVLGPLHPH